MANIKIDMMISEISEETSEQSAEFIDPMMETEMINDVEAMIQDTNEDVKSSRKCCIYRVPHTMRDPNNEDAYYYTPQVVSIGPFHHGSKKLKGMEKQKRMFLRRFVKRSETGWEDLVRFVMRKEPLVRASYSDEIEQDKKELMRLILVDAAFIIELFMILHVIRGENAGEEDTRKGLELLGHWWREAATKDLILLENQLPFFIINGLYKKAFPSAPSERNSNNNFPSFLDLTFTIFGSNKKVQPDAKFGEIKHFTDLIRSFFLARKETSDHAGEPKFIEDPSDLLLYSATELQEAGVKLKTSTEEGKSLLDLNFSSPPYFEIPEIFLEDRTEILFRNMIALEQCHYQFRSYITEYAFVLDCLINEHQDVDLLTHKKIIHNFLGNANDVANLFNGLRKNIMGEYIISTHYHGICKSLNDYCKRPWNKRMANLRRDYCKTAWHTMASAAAIVVILLTLIQTILAFFQI